MPNAGIMASAVSITSCTDVLKEPFVDLSSWTTTAGTPAIKSGRTGTGVELIGSFTTIDYAIPLAKQSDTITVGFAFKSSTMTSSGPILMLRSDNAATDHTRLNVISDGSIVTTIGTSGIAPSAAGVLAPNTWAYIEIQAKLHDTAGYHIVKVNNKTIFNTGLIDTKNGGTKTVYDTVRLIGMNTAVFDDLYISSGATCPLKGDMQIGGPCTEVLNEPFNNFTDAPWAITGGAPSIVAGRTGTAAQVSVSDTIEYTVPSAKRDEYFTIGFAWKISSAAAGERYILRVWPPSVGTTEHIRLMHASDGSIKAYGRGGANFFGASPTTGPLAIVPGTWYYIELQGRIHETLGSCVVRINNTEVIRAENVNTNIISGAASTATVFRLSPETSSVTGWYDDLYITTGIGCIFKDDPAGCNAFLQEPFDDLSLWTQTVGTPAIVSGGRTSTMLKLMGRGFTDGSSDAAFYNVATNYQSNTFTIGFAWKVDQSGVERLICQFKSEFIAHIELSTTASNGFAIHRGTSSGPVIDNSAGGLWTTGTWYYVELQARLGNAVGFVKVRVNGTLVINQTNVDTRLGGTKVKFDQVALATSHDQVQYVDDLYLSSGQGCAFQGDHTVVAPPPIPTGSLKGWYDANDTSKFTFSSGTVVSQWNDKSGLNNHMSQATAGNRPSRSGTQNGKPTVQFTSGKSLATAGVISTAGGEMTMIVAAKATSTDAIISPFYNGVLSSNGWGIALHANTNKPGFILGGLQYVPSSSSDTQQPCVLVCHRTGFLWTVWRDGSVLPGISNSNNFFGPGTSTLLGAGTTCDVFEAIFYDRILSTAERQQVEAYLKDKWNTGPPPLPIPSTGLEFWLDADDATTFNYSSGTIVSQWNDKSGNDRNLSQGTVANQPNRNGTQNGHATVVFDGVNDFLRTPSAPVSAVTDNFTAFVACKRTGPSSGLGATQSVVFHNGAPNSNGFGIALRANSGNIGILRAAIIQESTTTPDPAAPCVLTVQRSSTVWSMWLNRTATSMAATGGINTPTSATEVTSDTHLFGGEVYEVIFYSRVLTSTERNNVETYLKNKWGTP